MNQRELDVLNILWSTDDPMTAIDIVNKKKELTQSTVTAVIRKLLGDGLVETREVVHSGRVLARTYRPTEKSRTALLEYFIGQYSSFSKVISPEEICEAIKNIK